MTRATLSTAALPGTRTFVVPIDGKRDVLCIFSTNHVPDSDFIKVINYLTFMRGFIDWNAPLPQPTDDELIQLLQHGTLVWAVVNEDPEICYLIAPDGSERPIDPMQAERLYHAGAIEVPLPEFDWDMSFRWHLTSRFIKPTVTP